MSTECNPIIWKDENLWLLDQRLLPGEEHFVEVKTLKDCASAIRDMVVRGAPCIGFAAIYGVSLWYKNFSDPSQSDVRKACDELIAARPTAVNLAYEVERCYTLIINAQKMNKSHGAIFQELVEFGHLQIKESHEKNLMMAKLGVEDLKKRLKKDKWNLMTHCNTGFLACGSLGTALGVISHAHSLGLVEHVYADETRPYMQGSRLTAFELGKEKIPYSIVVEGAASYLLSHDKVDAIFVGADRIAANGDTANKVGTATLAIVANHYKIPFYVVAPTSSFDTSLENGKGIEIEMRDTSEITHFRGSAVAPVGAKSVNPSFDVTDHRLITGIICEKGLINPAKEGELVRIVKS